MFPVIENRPLTLPVRHSTNWTAVEPLPSFTRAAWGSDQYPAASASNDHTTPGLSSSTMLPGAVIFAMTGPWGFPAAVARTLTPTGAQSDSVRSVTDTSTGIADDAVELAARIVAASNPFVAAPIPCNCMRLPSTGSIDKTSRMGPCTSRCDNRYCRGSKGRRPHRKCSQSQRRACTLGMLTHPRLRPLRNPPARCRSPGGGNLGIVNPVALPSQREGLRRAPRQERGSQKSLRRRGIFS